MRRQLLQRAIKGCRGLSGRVWALPRPLRPVTCGPVAGCSSQAWVHQGDTIFALSSGAGRAGVAVVRVSGPGCKGVARKLLGQRKADRVTQSPRRAVLGAFRHPETQEILDQGLALFFPAPNSFTGDDVLELHCHGSRAVLAAVTSALHSSCGARPADAGEFTRRAFLAGKMDMTEVEALGDLLNAETDAQRRQALRQLDGDLSRLYEGWRHRLLRCTAHAEAWLDFGEDEMDVGEGVFADTYEAVAEVLGEVEAHLAANDRRGGEIVRSGLRVVLTGPPNAGKSSVLNALAQRDVAIVSEEAGTTRDSLEVSLDIAGVPVRLFDTAGLREMAAAGVVEQEGIRRARRAVADAHMRVCVYDAADYPGGIDGDSLSMRFGADLVLLNKSDTLGQGGRPDVAAVVAAAGREAGATPLAAGAAGGLEGEGEDVSWTGSGAAVPSEVAAAGLAEDPLAGLLRGPVPAHQLVSCRTGDGLDRLLAALEAGVVRRVEEVGEAASDGSAIITRQRHRDCLEDCREALERFAAAARPAVDPTFGHDASGATGLEADMATEELHVAIRALGRIVGRVDVEELLDVIFSDFCIGK